MSESEVVPEVHEGVVSPVSAPESAPADAEAAASKASAEAGDVAVAMAAPEGPVDAASSLAEPGPAASGADPVEGSPAVESSVAAATTRAPVDVAQVGQRLKDLFPALFKGQQRPLKLRIQNDIQQRAPGAFTKQALSAFFRRHTSSTGYLIAVAKAPHRFDLDGQPAGEIAEEHRKLAQEELDRRRGNRAEREALLDQQRRNRATLLRDFERTTLTRANFCALKGVEEPELDGLLELARQELQAQVPPPSNRPMPGRPDMRRGAAPQNVQRRR